MREDTFMAERLHGAPRSSLVKPHTPPLCEEPGERSESSRVQQKQHSVAEKEKG
ncbi:Hypothetical predicted protein [Lynx pardinus]|uniref:Uncharacterized protein n=1 Tax=Lynx pardinus TaxID=191816 RepID=A0A485P998_LYNPA|nr:Hypothetical predicted protein [Lynx pardinus]